MARRLVARGFNPRREQVNEEVILMEQTLPTNLLHNLQQGPLRLLEPLEQQIFCQRVEQYWGDVVRPLIARR